jgi:hypothetical protein
LDPVFLGVESDLAKTEGGKGGTTKKKFGTFFKDYRETEW